MATRRPRSGWVPYVAPYLAFLLIVEVGSRLPEAWAPWALFVRVLVPAALLVYYARQGAYPELRGYPGGFKGAGLDVGVGLATTALWMGPYLLGWLTPPPAAEGFDAGQLGEGLRGTVLATRLAGFALVTAYVEELFVRSFLIRAAELVSLQRGGPVGVALEIDDRRDFRDLPVARYTAWSFWITVGYFTLSHASWEWPVAFATGVLWNLYLYRRGHLAPLVVVHAVTNFSLFWVVVLTSGSGPGVGDGLLDLWYFL